MRLASCRVPVVVAAPGGARQGAARSSVGAIESGSGSGSEGGSEVDLANRCCRLTCCGWIRCWCNDPCEEHVSDETEVVVG